MTVALPVPKLLKRRDRGKGLYNARLENDRRLLRWAVNYIQIMTDDLHKCSATPDGNIKPFDVKLEIRRCRKWLTLARRQLE